MKKRIIVLFLLVAVLSNAFSVCYATSYSYSNQDVTAYTAYSSALTASGATPEVGYVAVHPKTWGSHTNPLFPFGAFITTTSELYLPNAGDGMTVFQVQDIGDVNNTRGLTKYWFDCYVGLKPTYDQAAINFGKQKCNYTVRW
ncbi:hypothetical protein [Ruminiclostridium josui]|uniref:hypothetical protein n=1 Tax=Ruminiclostridium josui TaxID=1499 RepID=UPI0004658AC9|nr:hypothetical protein [Ruminiclostridium josui]